MVSSSAEIHVAARQSALSQVQVQEVELELLRFHPHIRFERHYVISQGDKDQKTSLRTLGKSNFFTKEIDELVLSGQCRIGIHSAKDLPDPLPKGLALICLTQGLDPVDVLVLREGETLLTLPLQAQIATSSERREEEVKKLRPDLTFCDVRGTIAQRLDILKKGQADGVVVAEAALIRLGLTHLNRIRLPGSTTPGQGQLAILAREDDIEMGELFSCLRFST